MPSASLWMAGGERRSARPRHDQGVRLRLFGTFRLSAAGRALNIPVSAQRVAAFLALQQRWVSRPVVAGSLWEDSSDERANASLRSALWRLRCRGREVVESYRDRLRLAEHVWVDVCEFLATAHRLMDKPWDYTELAELLMGGELLSDWYDDWLVIERERIKQLWLHAMEAVCLRLSERGNHLGAIESGMAAVRLEPLRESAHRALIKAHLAEGNRYEALRAYRLFRERLRLEADCDPSPAMDDLVRSIR